MAINDIVGFLQQNDIILALAIVIGAYVIGQIVKLSVRKIAKKLAKKTKTCLDDELIRALEKPILYGITIAGIFIALLTVNVFLAYSGKMLIAAKIVGIIWGCWAIIRVVAALFRWYAQEIAIHTKSKMDDKYMHIFKRLINLIIYVIVGMLMLQELGVKITPLIASLGIGGLAIALALQDTLANFFSGFYMISDRAVEIGDYVEIEGVGGSVKGHVDDFGWRTSKLKTLTNNHVIIPNSSFANAMIVNYQAPKPEMSLIVPVGVSYDSDLDKVEKVTCEVISDTLKNIDGGVKDAKPLIRYKEFADSSINLIAILKIKDPIKQGIIRHEFIKRLKKRYGKEGIDIPFQIRTVIMNKE